jgi:transposase-like protein
MRLPASEKLEIIGLVEQSHLPARRTLQMLGIKPSTFYRWYDRFRSGGLEALEDKPSKPDRVWNRIPDDIRQRVVMMAFEQPELSPRELATRFTDTNSYYVSESSVSDGQRCRHAEKSRRLATCGQGRVPTKRRL